VLSDRGPDKDEIFIGSPKSRHEDTQLGFWPNSKGFGVEMQKQGKIHYSRDTFWGFLKSLEEEKGPQITNMENFI
jgi:hypothetical protein